MAKEKFSRSNITSDRPVQNSITGTNELGRYAYCGHGVLMGKENNPFLPWRENSVHPLRPSVIPLAVVTRLQRKRGTYYLFVAQNA